MTSLKTISLAVVGDSDPLVRTVLCRTVAKTLSTGFVTGMRISVPTFRGVETILAYGATIRDRGTGSTKVRAGRFWTLSCELVLVAGRLCDSPGCAESANP